VHAPKPSLRATHSKRPGARRSLRPVVAWDDALSDKHYEQLRALIQRRLGFHMPPGKRALLHGRIVRRARALQCGSLGAYCERVLQSADGSEELTHFLDLVTTNVTSFFREPAQLERVREFLAEWGHGCRDSGRELRVWSAACSRGHEVWTLAMMLSELPGSPRFSLLGTDVSSNVLKQAVDAVYPEAELASVPAAWRRRYFMHSRDRSARLARVVPELRQAAQFRQQNLIDPVLDAPRDFDVVLLRNVLIYFDATMQREIVRKVARHIRPGGLLCVGLAEALHGHRIGFEHLELGMYQRGAS
jgi:chemotaxis protein methyltransferase CheR